MKKKEDDEEEEEEEEIKQKKSSSRGGIIRTKRDRVQKMPFLQNTLLAFRLSSLTAVPIRKGGKSNRWWCGTAGKHVIRKVEENKQWTMSLGAAATPWVWCARNIICGDGELCDGGIDLDL